MGWVGQCSWPAPRYRVQSLSWPFGLIGGEMERKRFTEEQIIGILNEAEQAGSIREVFFTRSNAEIINVCRDVAD